MRDDRVHFGPPSIFYADLKKRVATYFEETGRSSFGGPAMWIKTVVLTLFTASAVALFLLGQGRWWEVLVYGACLGFGIAGIGFCVMHDANHGAYSPRPAVNRFFGFFMDLIGGSSHVWKFKHNIVHHTYANLVGVDQDIETGGLARFAPGQPWRPYHRLQYLYVWPLYAFLGLKWLWVDDFANILGGKLGQHKMARPKGRAWFVFLFGKAFIITFTFVLPAVLHGFWTGLAFHVWSQMVSGITLATVFQMAHCVEEAEFPAVPTAPDDTADWAMHQLRTAVDFSRGNPFITWYFGGLNYQTVHHLFPRVCHIHYPAISRILEATCADHGLRYRINETFPQAVASHIRLLRRLGRRPAASSSAKAA